MRYFIVQAELCFRLYEDSRNPRVIGEKQDILDTIGEACMSYIRDRKGKSFGILKKVHKQSCTLIAAADGDDEAVHGVIADFWKYLKLDGEIVGETEIGVMQAFSELRCTDPRYEDDLQEVFGIDVWNRIRAEEKVVTGEGDTQLAEFAALRHIPALCEEAERIAAPAQHKGFMGHPVHYIVEENDERRAHELITHLVRALRNAERLQTGRVIFLNENSFRHINITVLDDIYQNIRGGTVVIEASQYIQADEFADECEELFAKAASCARQYRHEVLTVFHIPQHNTEARHTIAAYLNNDLKTVTFAEESCTYEKAADYIRHLCAEKQVTEPEMFLEKLDRENGVYYIADLERIFNETYSAYLTAHHFPAYLHCESSAVLEKKAEGKAADTLQEMIGLDSVKQVIAQSVGYFQMQKLWRERGLAAKMPARSMIFTGNPGTAKTTVARLTARIFKDNGLLESGKIVEVGRADLVGRYVGWTAPTVKAAFQRAKGSILFIDEAYALVDGRDGSFGDEAINTIVQEMENHREETIVIFAGYPDKMERFLEKNPGLRSRIAFHVDFPDYSPDELTDILRLMAANQSMTVSDEAAEKAHMIFAQAVRIPDFGNGRFVRNLLEQAQMNMALRLAEHSPASLTDAQLTTLCAEDFSMPLLCRQQELKRAIGF